MFSTTSLLARVFSSPARIRTLKALFDHGGGLSGRGVAKAAGLALRPTQDALKALEHFGLVLCRRGRLAHEYSLNESHVIWTHGLKGLFQMDRERAGSVIDDIARHAQMLLGGSLPQVIHLSAGSDLEGDRVALMIYAVTGLGVEHSVVWNELSRISQALEASHHIEISVDVCDGDSLARRLRRGKTFGGDVLIAGRSIDEIVPAAEARSAGPAISDLAERPGALSRMGQAVRSLVSPT